MTDNGNAHASLEATLAAIADALGVPVEALKVDTLQSGVAPQTAELLTLWTQIESEAGRRVLLEYARRLARIKGCPTPPVVG